MSYFCFEISNSLTTDQQFLLEADDMVSAHMKALDFVRQIDEGIRKRWNVEETTEVTMVSKASLLMADEAGATEYVESIEVYAGDEDE